MTHYKLGGIEFILEKVIAIGERWGYDANTVKIMVYLEGGQRLECIIKAEEDERADSYSHAHTKKFMEAFCKKDEQFRFDWRNIID